nr:hypothetical protein NG677_03920 [Methylobacterium sp. OTU13CASTA1]
MDIQALLNTLSHSAKQTRSGYHMTLGKLIAALEAAPQDAVVRLDSGGFPADPHSYRGYYEDLSFKPAEGESPTVAAFLTTCRGVHGQTLTGYKGGDFLMGDDAVLWVAGYGQSSGLAMTGASVNDGVFTIATKQVED